MTIKVNAIQSKNKSANNFFYGVAVGSVLIMSNKKQLTLSGTQKEHYKMYKKGRFWLFAGVLVMTTWQGNQVVSHADETATTDTGEQTPAVTTVPTQLTGKTVILGAETTSSVKSESDSVLSDSPTTSTEATSASTVSDKASSASPSTTSTATSSTSVSTQD
ncbi:KxYKxGKxW signal peptide domain-containing protein, partial [Enterococcus faecium]